MRSILILLPTLVLPLPTVASTWTVEPDGSGDFATIQEAVDLASDGDEILLGDGTFTGPGNRQIDFLGKAITVRSASGDPTLCGVDADFHTGFRFGSGEGAGSVLADISISDTVEYAIFCDGSSPTFRNLHLGYSFAVSVNCRNAGPTFEDVLAVGSHWTTFFLQDSPVVLRDVEIRYATRAMLSEGGSPELERVTVRDAGCPALEFRGGAPLIRGCLLEANTRVASTGPAGAIFLENADATIENTVLVGNGQDIASLPYLGGSALSMTGSSPVVRDCLLAGNRSREGGAVKVGPGSFPTFERCTIAGNEARRGGGFHVADGAGASLTGVIVWGNCASETGADGYLAGPGAAVDADCAVLSPDLWEGAGSLVLGSAVLTSDPLFCGPVDCTASPTTAGVYTLDAASPALAHACGTIGALGPGCAATNVGASLETRSWGSVKSLFRSGRR